MAKKTIYLILFRIWIWLMGKDVQPFSPEDIYLTSFAFDSNETLAGLLFFKGE